MNVAKLIEIHPRLYHMAECGSWPTIRQHGLLSTTALLDSHQITGQRRSRYESQHRPEKITLQSQNFPDTVLRDQKPMNDQRLISCLQGGVTPRQWYELLNSKTFFWATEERLLTLLSARAYRNEEHDVLTIDTARLVQNYAPQISLCHMNSGNTFPMPHLRGTDIFKPIQHYPTKDDGRPVKPIVEVVVEYGVPDIAQYVISVRRMRDGAVLSTIL